MVEFVDGSCVDVLFYVRRLWNVVCLDRGVSWKPFLYAVALLGGGVFLIFWTVNYSFRILEGY